MIRRRRQAVHSIIRDDTEALDLLDQAMKGRQGERTDLVDIINEVRPNGTSRDQALRRLRKDRPDLHAKVLAGELSAHRAMVEAGFRHRPTALELGGSLREIAKMLGIGLGTAARTVAAP